MDSDLNQSLLSTDVENPETYAYSLNSNMDAAQSTYVISALFRKIPSIINHTSLSSTPRVVDENDQQAQDDDESSKIIVFDDGKERERLDVIMKAGLANLLSGVDDTQGLLYGLGIKVILEIDHEQIQEDFEDSAEKTSCDKLHFKLNPQDAVGLLLDYAGFWLHSCSIVQTDLHTAASNRKLSYTLKGRKMEESNQSSSGYAEVVLFVLVEGQTDVECIPDSEQLKKFLTELSENHTLGAWKKVHGSCSSYKVREESSLPSSAI